MPKELHFSFALLRAQLVACAVDRWLDRDTEAAEVLKPCPAAWLEAYPVDKRVGNVRNNDAGLIEPL